MCSSATNFDVETSLESDYGAITRIMKELEIEVTRFSQNTNEILSASTKAPMSLTHIMDNYSQIIREEITRSHYDHRCLHDDESEQKSCSQKINNTEVSTCQADECPPSLKSRNNEIIDSNSYWKNSNSNKRNKIDMRERSDDFGGHDSSYVNGLTYLGDEEMDRSDKLLFI
mmetsp:Transcript_21178/g.24382  ORF Transcript_21178/g.24382 Transcript_21178/m.24382 type:complete len:172 (+) Transcript_21178:144-659(+)